MSFSIVHLLTGDCSSFGLEVSQPLLLCAPTSSVDYGHIRTWFHLHVANIILTLVLITLIAQEEDPPLPDSMILHSIARHDTALLTRTYEVTSTPTIPRLSSHCLGSDIHIFTSKLLKTRPRGLSSRLYLFTAKSFFLCG